jgi:hypothetical protein
MKYYRTTRQYCGVELRRRTEVAAKITAAAAFALMFAVAMAGPSQAQDASKGGSSWDWLDSVRLDSVLVLPPVYRPDAESAPADAYAAGCPDSSDPGLGESPSAVTGTADDPANASAGTADNSADESAGSDDSAPDGSGSQEQQAAASGDPQSADSLDSSLGSIQDYEAQQTAAAELGNYGIVQAPSVIIAAPVGRYYTRRTFLSAAPVFAPTARVVPRPSIVLPRFPRTVGGVPSGFFGGFRGDGFSHMSGVHGGFGHMSGVHGGFGHMSGIHGGFGHMSGIHGGFGHR